MQRWEVHYKWRLPSSEARGKRRARSLQHSTNRRPTAGRGTPLEQEHKETQHSAITNYLVCQVWECQLKRCDFTQPKRLFSPPSLFCCITQSRWCMNILKATFETTTTLNLKNKIYFSIWIKLILFFHILSKQVGLGIQNPFLFKIIFFLYSSTYVDWRPYKNTMTVFPASLLNQQHNIWLADLFLQVDVNIMKENDYK